MEHGNQAMVTLLKDNISMMQSTDGDSLNGLTDKYMKANLEMTSGMGKAPTNTQVVSKASSYGKMVR